MCPNVLSITRPKLPGSACAAALFFYLFIVAAAVMPPALLAATTLNGVIEHSSRWVLEDSPYIIDQTVVVTQDAAVTVEPKVLIRFRENGKLVVKGRFDADKAIFDGFRDLFNRESLQMMPGSRGTFRACVIRNLSLELRTSDVDVTHCFISNRNGTGITVGKTASPLIRANDFNNNSYYAVYNEGHDPLVVPHNFWGAADGPSGFGPGSGDALNANILYQPFETTAINQIDYEPLEPAAAEPVDDAPMEMATAEPIVYKPPAPIAAAPIAEKPFEPTKAEPVRSAAPALVAAKPIDDKPSMLMAVEPAIDKPSAPTATKRVIRLVAYTNTPQIIEPGGTFTLEYLIRNDGEGPHELILGASIKLPGAEPINSPQYDLKVEVAAGVSRLARRFLIPFQAPRGTYDVWWGVMDLPMEKYFSFVRESNRLQVGSDLQAIARDITVTLSASAVNLGQRLVAQGKIIGKGTGPLLYRWQAQKPDGTWYYSAILETGMKGGTAAIPPFVLPTHVAGTWRRVHVSVRQISDNQSNMETYTVTGP